MTNLQKGLVGHWTMDDRDTSGGTLYDRSAYDNHGALGGTVSSPTTSQSGQIGESFRFTGEPDSVSNPEGQWVEVSSSPEFDTTSFSVSAWCYVPSGSNNDGDEIILQNRYQPGFWFQPDVSYISESGASYPLNLNTNPPKDEWFHVVTTYDGSTHKMYYNGVEETSQTQSVPGSVETSLQIGTWSSKASNHFDGRIDDLRFYNRALTASEVSSLYQMRSPRVQQDDLSKGLVGHWTCDAQDTSNGTLYDRSAYDNHGSINGGITTDESGQLNKSISFNGNGGEIVVSDSSSLDVTDEVTVCGWIYPKSGETSQDQDVFGKTNSYGFHIFDGDDDGTTGTVFSDIWIGGSRINPIVGEATFDTWTHIAVTYDGSEVRSYYNSSPEAADSVTGTIDTTGQPFGIAGNDYPLGRGFFFGRVDDVRVYNRALTADEISRLYQMRTQKHYNV